MGRTFVIFAVAAVLHFVLSVIGIVVALPAAFDTQAGFWMAPGKALLAWVGAVLLAPLSWVQPWLPQGRGNGYAEIAVLSALFGAAAAGVAFAWRAIRRERPTQ